MKSKNIIVIILFALIFLLSVNFVNAQTAQNVCCEKTVNNLFCQNVPSNQCASGSLQAPTSCDSTSFCKPGTCYDTREGLCLDNTPKAVCNSNSSVWSAESPAQCNLGCCVLGDQAAFVSLVRCKRLASDLGLAVNYNKNIQNEAQCILSVQNQDKGACVYEFEFEKTCKFTTREVCNTGVDGNGRGEFFKDKLCTNPELGTNCAATTKTICVPGKEEVYFVDSCGNPANIYDSDKFYYNTTNREDVKNYWSEIKTPEQSCAPGSNNANSKTCGNCNYLLGSICRADKPGSSTNICADLNCHSTSVGEKKHGESWCVNKDSGDTGSSKNSVGSRFYKHICINGEEVVEPCADYRQEECIQDSIKTANNVEFTQAACRVNRWQDCLDQTNQADCENRDRRDCKWSAGASIGKGDGGSCLPLNTPGLKFWDGKTATQICAQANVECKVTFEKGLFGDEECSENCQCLSDSWTKERIALCTALGDCGANVNWISDAGYKPGYTLVTA